MKTITRRAFTFFVTYFICINASIAQIKTTDLFKTTIYRQNLVPQNIAFAYSILDVAELQLYLQGALYGAEYNLNRIGMLQLKNGKIVPTYDNINPLDSNGFYSSLQLGMFPLGNNCFATFQNSLTIIDSGFNTLYTVQAPRISQMTGRTLHFDAHGFGESIINNRYVVIGMEEFVVANTDDSLNFPFVVPGTTIIRYPAGILYDLQNDTVVKGFFFSDHKSQFPLSGVNWAELTDSTDAGPVQYDGFHINETSFDPMHVNIDSVNLEILFGLRNYKDGLVLVDLFADSVMAVISDTTMASPHGAIVKCINDSIRILAIHNDGYFNINPRHLSLDQFTLNINTKQFSKTSSFTIPEYSWSQILGQYLPWRGDYYPGLQDYTWVTVGGNIVSPAYQNINQNLRGILYYQDSIRVMDISMMDTVVHSSPVLSTTTSTLVYDMHPIIWNSEPRIICNHLIDTNNLYAYPSDTFLYNNAHWYKNSNLIGTSVITPPFQDSALYYFTTPCNYNSGIRYSEYLTGAEITSMCPNAMAFSANAGLDTSICLGEQYILGGSPTATGGSGNYSYAWSPFVGLNDSTIANPSAEPTVTTTYIVTVTDANGTSVVSTPVTVLVIDHIPSITPSGTQTICAGQSITLDAGAGYSSYLWTTSDTTQTITIDTSGIYNVTVAQNGCTGSTTDTITVITNSSPNASLNNSNITGKAANPLTALPANAQTYIWQTTTDGGASYTTLETTQTNLDTAYCICEMPGYTNNGSRSLGCSPIRVVVINSAGCSDTSNLVSPFCIGGVNDLEESINFSIQPNPSNDILNVSYDLNKSSSVAITILDLAGRRIMNLVNENQPTGKHNQMIQLNGLASGIYLLNFATEFGSLNSKFVKE